MLCSGTRASADSSRMVISFRLISRLKITVGKPCLIAAARARSSASVELCVGIIAAARQVQVIGAVHLDTATGTDGTGRTSTM